MFFRRTYFRWTYFRPVYKVDIFSTTNKLNITTQKLMKFEVKLKKQVRLGQVGIGSKKKISLYWELKIQAKPIRKSQPKPKKTSKTDLTWLSKKCPVENMSSFYTGQKCVHRKCVRRKYVRR